MMEKKTSRRYLWLLPIIIIVIGSLGVAFYFHKQSNKLARELAKIQANPSLVAEEEAKELKELISRLMVLPEGEEPSVATVNELESLKNQPFFAQASVGDKVLIYMQAKKAILYSPSLNKIIDISPINLDPAATQTTQPPESSQDEVAAEGNL